jgi:copper(I)-binding protein
MRCLLTALLLIVLTSSASGGNDIVVDNAWIREAPPGASMMAAYLVINNLSDSDVELVGVDSPSFAHVMMHKSETVDGVARMIHQDSLVIPAHGSLALEPGSFHLMMPAPETRLTQGDKVDLMLHFADERSLQVTAVVRKKP